MQDLTGGGAMKDRTFFTLLGVGMGFGGIFVMNRHLLIGAIISCLGIYFWCAAGRKRRAGDEDRTDTRDRTALGN